MAYHWEKDKHSLLLDFVTKGDANFSTRMGLSFCLKPLLLDLLTRLHSIGPEHPNLAYQHMWLYGGVGGIKPSAFNCTRIGSVLGAKKKKWIDNKDMPSAVYLIHLSGVDLNGGMLFR